MENEPRRGRGGCRNRLITIPLRLAILAVVIAAVVSFSAIGIMLQALHVFTQETVVAEVVMYPMQTDTQGPYILIEYTPIQQQGALETVISPSGDDVARFGQVQEYKIYGDTVAIRGPFIKLHDGLLLLNFDNVYKLSLIEGEYRRTANSTSHGEGTEIPLNGGFDDSWWFVNDEEGTFPYNLVVDRMTFSGDEEPGFTGTGRKKYEVVVTHDTITWNLVGTFEQ